MSVSKELRFKDVDGKETTIEFAVNAKNIQESNFTEAKVRENLKSGESVVKMLGKLAKWFTDLSKLAWSGKWADVGDKPGIGDLEGTLGVEKGGTGATSASGARKNLGIGAAATYPIADNDTTNNANYVPTARIVYEHGKEIDALSRDLNAINDNGAIKGMDAREDGVYITYVPSSGADSVTKKLGSEPQLLGTLTGNGTFDCKKIANYKQLTKDNFFIIPKTVRARFNAPRGTDSSNMGWNSTKELKSIEYNADTGILSFYLTTSDSYSYGSYWTKSYSIDITGDLYCVF